MKFKIIYSNIHNQHIKMIKNIQKPFIGKPDILSKAMVNVCNQQLIKINEVATPKYLIRKK